MVSRWSDSATGEKILRKYRRWAVVGCSNDRRRPSYDVASFLSKTGYEIICVNPNHESCIPKLPCHRDLRSISQKVEVVDIFRRSEAVLPHVEEAIEIGAKAIWMQLGVVNEEAAELAHENGLDVVMDRCPKIDFRPEFLERVS